MVWVLTAIMKLSKLRRFRKMTNKNKEKLERKLRRLNTGKLWSGYKPRTTKTKKEKEVSIRDKYRKECWA